MSMHCCIGGARVLTALRLPADCTAEAAACRAAEALVQKALQLGTKDNVTAAVMLFRWD